MTLPRQLKGYWELCIYIGLNFEGQWIYVGEEFQTLNSPSYPGLNSCYHMFNYQIMLSTTDLSKLRFAEVRDPKLTLFTLEAID